MDNDIKAAIGQDEVVGQEAELAMNWDDVPKL